MSSFSEATLHRTTLEFKNYEAKIREQFEGKIHKKQDIICAVTELAHKYNDFQIIIILSNLNMLQQKMKLAEELANNSLANNSNDNQQFELINPNEINQHNCTGPLQWLSNRLTPRLSPRSTISTSPITPPSTPTYTGVWCTNMVTGEEKKYFYPNIPLGTSVWRKNSPNKSTKSIKQSSP